MLRYSNRGSSWHFPAVTFTVFTIVSTTVAFFLLRHLALAILGARGTVVSLGLVLSDWAGPDYCWCSGTEPHLAQADGLGCDLKLDGVDL